MPVFIQLERPDFFALGALVEIEGPLFELKAMG